MEYSQPSQGDEEFIDMVVGPSLQSKEFEFQMCKTSLEKEEVTPSPADELFYKGKLLPLHLPPRLQMVQNLLQNSISQNQAFEEEEEECETPIFSTTSFTAPLTNSNSPLESCSISPTDSCRVSCELNPDEYFFQWSTGVSALTKGDAHLSKKPWSKKIKLIKQFVFSQKLKSSRDYMKSLFTRPACTVEAKSAGVGGEEGWNISKAKEYNIIESEIDDHISFTCHRLSFSGALKRNSTSNKHSSSSSSATTTTTSSTSSSNCSCSSSSYSLKSTKGFYEINLLKKGVSANLEAENSIEGAIAHCKKSQQKQDFSEEKRHQSEVEERKHAEREEER